MKYLSLMLVLFASTILAHSQTQSNMKLVVRADDMGFCRSANIASIDGYKNGIITSVEVLATGAWFLDAAAMLKENAGLDVGVHLCLNSEWDNFKWGPLTYHPTLVDDNGYFPTTTEELVALNASKDIIKAEFKAQIELAIKHIPQVSHLSTHMFSPDITPAIKQAIKELSEEYNLHIAPVSMEAYAHFWDVVPDGKKDYLMNYLASLSEGTHIFVHHPIVLDGESKAIKGSGPDPNVNMAIHRHKVLEAITNPDAKILIEKRGIELIGIKDIKKEGNK